MEYRIKTLNAISSAIYTQLGDNYRVSDDAAYPQAVLVRSASMHDMEIPASVLSIARAGAGYNNIPVDACSKKGICVFNTPGANAMYRPRQKRSKERSGYDDDQDWRRRQCIKTKNLFFILSSVFMRPGISAGVSGLWLWFWPWLAAL